MRFPQYSTSAVLTAHRGRSLAYSALFMAALACMGTNPAAAMPLAEPDFDPSRMLRLGADDYSSGSSSSFSVTNPARFSMQQSYSLSAMSGPHGSLSSGLYLNTLSYQFTPLLVAFVDVGFYTPLHSSIPGLEQGAGMGSLVLPRVGLEYRPTERLSLNLELVNGPDAWKAYGGLPRSSHFLQGSRIP
jgi:hypothetical protein